MAGRTLHFDARLRGGGRLSQHAGLGGTKRASRRRCTWRRTPVSRSLTPAYRKHQGARITARRSWYVGLPMSERSSTPPARAKTLFCAVVDNVWPNELTHIWPVPFGAGHSLTQSTARYVPPKTRHPYSFAQRTCIIVFVWPVLMRALQGEPKQLDVANCICTSISFFGRRRGAASSSCLAGLLPFTQRNRSPRRDAFWTQSISNQSAKHGCSGLDYVKPPIDTCAKRFSRGSIA